MGNQEMIIFYNKPNTLSLPYIEEKTRLQKYFRFIPGKNHLPEKIWLAIVKAANKRMEYYETVLTVFKPKDSIDIKVDKDDKEEVISVDVGTNENDIDYNTLNVHEMISLIDNTMEISELEHLRSVEEKRDTVRKTVMKALDKKVEEIREVEEALKKKE